jgi:hypothetical protein
MAIVAASIAVVALTLSFFIYPMSVVALAFAVIDLIFSFIVLLIDIRPGKYVPSYLTKFGWILSLLALIICIAAIILCFI